jgi:ERCC4-type nuclease
MITIDSRIGSRELLSHFAHGVAQLGHLEFADAAFLGTRKDSVMSIGVERKALSDFLGSMQTGRLAAVQLPGLRASYDVVYVVLEGVWKVHPDGRILVPRGKGNWDSFHLGRRQFTSRELDGFVNSLQVEAGVVVRETSNMHHTAMLIYNLYRWWQKSDHASILAMHKNRFADDGAGGALLTPPSLRRRVASELPGIGFKRSLAVADHFPTVRAMVNAEESDWKGIEGVGKTTAKRVVAALSGEGK